MAAAAALIGDLLSSMCVLLSSVRVGYRYPEINSFTSSPITFPSAMAIGAVLRPEPIAIPPLLPKLDIARAAVEY